MEPCDLPNKQATLTLNAPAHQTYGDGLDPNATLTGKIPGVNNPSINHTKGTVTISAPTDAGSYGAFCQLGNATARITYTINKVDITMTTAPAAVEGLVYSGTAQTLITAGTASAGTVLYSTDGTTFSAELPKGTNAGTYTVTYKVEGDKNHNALAAQTLSVTIATNKTALNNAINEAENYYNSIKDGNPDAANALKQAIDAAKNVKDNADATQAEVDNAVTALGNAKTAAEDAVAALADAKTNAKNTVNNVNATDYVAGDQQTVTNAKNTALEAIDAATSEAAVNEALNAFNTAIANCTTQETADQAAADAVKEKIDALPAANDVKLSDKDAIEEARNAYDALNPNQKAKVDANTEKKLKDAEAALKAAEEKDKEDTAAANAVKEKIDALPAANDVKASDKKAIEEARKAYDALTNDQKAKVDSDTLKKLQDAETALNRAQAAIGQAIDNAAANAVKEKIDALPAADDVKASDKEAIEEARKAYDDLTPAQKARIDADTLKKLEDAEEALKAAEGEVKPELDTSKLNEGIVTVKGLTGAQLKKGVWARVTSRYIDANGEGVMLVTSAKVDSEGNFEMPSISMPKGYTMDFRSVIITDTAAPANKLPSDVNKIIRSTTL